MTTHGSAIALEETPHATETTTITISDALRRRAKSVINDRTIDPQWRPIIRYALEANDPWLADIVRRAEAGETIIDRLTSLSNPKRNLLLGNVNFKTRICTDDQSSFVQIR